MTRCTASHRRTDRGAAIVELPLVFVAVSIFVLCVTALGQVLLDYHHVSGAARAGARYATKSDFDPTRAPVSATRRPSDAEVVEFTRRAAAPIAPEQIDVEVAPDPIVGRGAVVAASHTVSGGPYDLVTGTANALLDLLTLGPLPPVTVRATSTAVYE